MIKMYLKQAWMLMKQNRLFTGIYVVGTGLSIALVMTMFIIFYVKFAPIYPEYNRNRMLVVKAVKRYPKGQPDDWRVTGGGSYYLASTLLPGLPHIEKIGVGSFSWNPPMVSASGVDPQSVTVGYADSGYWDVFTFRFLCGNPFTQEEVEAVQPVAVLSESLARSLFASTDVVGRHFLFGEDDFRVCGVVADVSNATPETAYDLWLPLSHTASVAPGLGNQRLQGSIYTYLLVDEARNMKLVQEEVEDAIRKFNLQDEDYDFDLMGQPDPYWVSTFRHGMHMPDLMEVGKSFLYMLLALLFIPALNLSGMISSRMNHRLCELGVRKAYGANNRQLLGQVLCENLLLTVLGGLMGLLISYLIVLTASDWILQLFDERVVDPTKSVTLTPEMLFNPSVFGITFGLCLLLNVVSALLPALSALHHTIVSSLHTNR